MKFNFEWLRDWVGFEGGPEQLAEELTIAGLEVDSVTPASAQLEGVIVGHVISASPHPNADRLSLCRVYDGQKEHDVVCGAPNVRAGLNVPFAPIGTTLPNGQVIKAAKIRGTESHGMLCSAKELSLADDADGLLVLDAGAEAGVPLMQHLQLPDWVVDVDLTPNRGDCFSVLGMAREVAARTGLELNGPVYQAVSAKHDLASLPVLNAPSDCPRFVTRVLTDIDAGAATPDWMKERLRRSGLRALNPVVDVTNYVMLELGQPLHAYDLNRLSGSMHARRAAPGEPLVLLDGTSLELSDDVLVIADDSGAIGLAGIMGGSSTAIASGSTEILLEAAFFSPEVIQGRARRFGLHTDASVRFERGVDPTGQVRAIERATELLALICGASPGPVAQAVDEQQLPDRRKVRLRHRRVEAVLGTEIAAESIETWLSRLGMSVTQRTTDEWNVVPPAHRFDISIEEDLIEEVGRMLGYDSIVMLPGQSQTQLGSASEHRVEPDELSDLMIARGFSEVITYSFVDPEVEGQVTGIEVPAALTLANPLSAEQSVMRSSLWPGLIRAVQQNLSRQQARNRLFEIGTVFRWDGQSARESLSLAAVATGSSEPEHWDGPARSVDYYDLKGDVTALLDATGRGNEFSFADCSHPALNPATSATIVIDDTNVGYIGTLHPRIQRQWDLRDDVLLFELNVDAAFVAHVPTYATFSKYPSVRRDVAVVVDESVKAGDLTKRVSAELGATLRSAIVFDQYRGGSIEPGRKSIGLGLILQDASRTLTDADADQALTRAQQCLEREFGAKIRT